MFALTATANLDYDWHVIGVNADTISELSEHIENYLDHLHRTKLVARLPDHPATLARQLTTRPFGVVQVAPMLQLEVDWIDD